MKVPTGSEVRGIAIPSNAAALAGYHFSNMHPGFMSSNNNNMSSLKGIHNLPSIANIPNLNNINNSSSNNSSVNSSNSPPSPTSSASSRYKTELCRPFEEFGTCKYGDKCQFAHGAAELRRMTRHPKYKTEPCKTFHTLGLCPYGHRCHFIHNEAIMVSNQGNNNGLGAANLPSGQMNPRDSRAGSILYTSGGSVSSTTSSSSSPSPPLSASPTGSFEADQLFDYGSLSSSLHHHVAAAAAASGAYHHHHNLSGGQVLGSPTAFTAFPGFHGIEQQFSPRLPIFNSFFPASME